MLQLSPKQKMFPFLILPSHDRSFTKVWVNALFQQRNEYHQPKVKPQDCLLCLGRNISFKKFGMPPDTSIHQRVQCCSIIIFLFQMAVKDIHHVLFWEGEVDEPSIQLRCPSTRMEMITRWKGISTSPFIHERLPLLFGWDIIFMNNLYR